MRVRYLRMNKYILLVSHLCTVLSSVYSGYLVHTAVGSDSLSYGVGSQAFFDVYKFVLKLAPTRDDSSLVWKFLTLIALFCNPKLSPAGQQTVKHDGFHTLLSVLLTVPPFSFVMTINLMHQHRSIEIAIYTASVNLRTLQSNTKQQHNNKT